MRSAGDSQTKRKAVSGNAGRRIVPTERCGGGQRRKKLSKKATLADVKTLNTLPDMALKNTRFEHRHSQRCCVVAWPEQARGQGTDRKTGKESIESKRKQGRQNQARLHWRTFWSRPQADVETPIEPCEAIRCHQAIGKGHFQLARCSAKRRSLTSTRRRYEVDIRAETLDGSSNQKLRMGTASGKCWRTVESDIDDTKRRIGEIQV